MSYKIVFHEEAVKDLDNLDNSLKIFVLMQIKKLSENPELGDYLGNKAGMNLTGFRKLYLLKKKLRIVYKIVESELVVFIIAISKRDIGEVYNIASERE